MAKIVVVVNPKGGVGKTSTFVNVAAGLTRSGYRVRGFDGDPQGSSMLWSLGSSQYGFEFEVVGSRNMRAVELRRQTDCDIILVDTPSGLLERTDQQSQFARDALSQADNVLIPLQPATMDFRACVPFVKYLQLKKPPLERCGIVINRRKGNHLGKTARDRAAELFASIPSATVFQTAIGDRTSITEVPGTGKTIFGHVAPSHLAAQEYFALTKEIIEWLVNAPK